MESNSEMIDGENVPGGGGTPDSSAAMLDQATEDALYRRYRAFFKTAEETRRWDLWGDVPWESVNTAPSGALTDAVLSAYRDELFIPDYSAKLLWAVRSSRGRAWFVTRWTYEEGKHLLALNEWLTRSGARTDDQLKALSDELLTAYRWEPTYRDAPTALADALAWEMREIDTYRVLRRLAEQEGDPALTEALRVMISDEEAHRTFFHDALRIITERHPELVNDAVRRAAAEQESQAHGNALLALFDLSAE